MNQETETTTLPRRQIVANFKSRSCECGKLKQENTAFCGSCYRSLPQAMKNALWRAVLFKPAESEVTNG